MRNAADVRGLSRKYTSYEISSRGYTREKNREGTVRVGREDLYKVILKVFPRDFFLFFNAYCCRSRVFSTTIQRRERTYYCYFS